MRLWATIGVVVLHSSAQIVTVNRQADVDLFSRFNIGNGYDSLGRFGVNCFFMISGALLLSPQHHFRVGKQIRRVLIPLLVWSAVYALANWGFDRFGLPTMGGSNRHAGSLVGALQSFFIAPLSVHLWFVYVLLGIYLVIPLLRPLTALSAEVRTRLLRYALVIWLVFTVLIPTARHLWPPLSAPYLAAFPDLPTGYLGVVLLGFYLHHRKIAAPNWALLLGAAAGVTAAALLVYLEQTWRDGSLWGYGNLTPHVLLFSACVFLLAKSTLDRPGRAFPFISLFSALSFRIYLVHILILHYLTSMSPLKDWYATQPLVAVPVLAALTLAASFVVAWLIEQIKPISAYV